MPKIIFLIGPGAVGKTTIAKLISKKLGYNIIDLDEEFMSQIDSISSIIETKGYLQYVKLNSNLAAKLVSKLEAPTVFVTSSGFLKDTQTEIGKANIQLVSHGISILLLPSKFPKVSAKIMANRQVQRSFNTKTLDYYYAESLKRHYSYKNLGDIKIFSSKPAEEICKTIFSLLPPKLLQG